MYPTQLSWAKRGELWLRLGVRLLIVGLSLLFIWKAMPPLLSLFAPFVFAFMAATLLNPIVRQLQRRLNWNRGILTMFVLVFLLCGLGSLIWILIGAVGRELITLLNNWESIVAQSVDTVNQLELLFDELWALVPPDLVSVIDSIYVSLLSWTETAAPQLLESLTNRSLSIAKGAPSFILALLMFLIASYFITADYPYLRSRTKDFLSPQLLHFASQVKRTTLSAFGGYLRAQFLLSMGVFCILIVGFFFMGQGYGVLLALVLSMIDFIPILGAGTVMVPWAFLCLFTMEFRTAFSLMIIWGIITLFRRMAEPKVVGNQTGLSPILSLVSIYVGMKLAGVLGMILGPIVALIILNLSEIGLFKGIRMDFAAVGKDVSAILATEPDD